jgi:hypothetical protein
MIRPRVSIGWLMLAVALIGFHLAVVCADSSVLGLNRLEVGLLPGVSVLALTLFATRGRRGEKSETFVRGFVASLTAAIGIYIVCCLTMPEHVRWPIVYYINAIEPSLYDADLAMVYRLSLEIQGMIVGVPLLLFALGGAATRAIVARAGTRTRAVD